jgi:BlaI family transcriptional regulator, penicillinase repressor
MARPLSRHPTELELEILKILWRGGPMPVRQVREALAPSRELAYTSVMTIMNIMVTKGYLARQKSGASFVYQPRVSADATARGMLGDVVRRVFDGSVTAVVARLLESADLTERELKQLREMLDAKRKGAGK